MRGQSEQDLDLIRVLLLSDQGVLTQLGVELDHRLDSTLLVPLVNVRLTAQIGRFLRPDLFQAAS